MVKDGGLRETRKRAPNNRRSIIRAHECVCEGENEGPLGVVGGAPGSACIQPARTVKAFSTRLDKGTVGCSISSSSPSGCVGAVLSKSCCWDRFSTSDQAAPRKSKMIAAVPDGIGCQMHNGLPIRPQSNQRVLAKAGRDDVGPGCLIAAEERCVLGDREIVEELCGPSPWARGSGRFRRRQASWRLREQAGGR